MNRLRALLEYGQSVWLDYIRRGLIASGELQRLIDEDGLRGITSNPAIFEKAIIGSTDYAEALARMDLRRPVYEQATRRDGFVSLEVSPYLAHDMKATIDEAKRLWRIIGRPNVMI